MSRWEHWLGRTERRVDRVDETRLTRWLATLDRKPPADATVPQGFHWCLFTPDEPTARLGDDGHPARDGSEDSFLPPIPLPRRMWAAGQLDFLRPLRVGEAVERLSRISSITRKQGSSGDLVFVDIEHSIEGGAGPAVHELQSIVYREPATGNRAPGGTGPDGGRPHAAASCSASRTIRPSEALLFRYSALTFNTHRIHYDRPYATQEEGYAGVVVQGPLTATLLLDLARRELGDNALASFAFRGVSPAIAGNELALGMTMSGEEMDFIASTGEGRPVMTARGTRQAAGLASES